MVTHLTKETFIEKVFDFTTEKDWNFKGNKPALIDFWAEWCGPCRAVGPIIDELDKDYKGTVDFYKVNTEEQQELAAIFGIRSIPSLLFIPVDGKPQMAAGALPKETFEKAIADVLKIEKPE